MSLLEKVSIEALSYSFENDTETMEEAPGYSIIQKRLSDAYEMLSGIGPEETVENITRQLTAEEIRDEFILPEFLQDAHITGYCKEFLSHAADAKKRVYHLTVNEPDRTYTTDYIAYFIDRETDMSYLYFIITPHKKTQRSVSDLSLDLVIDIRRNTYSLLTQDIYECSGHIGFGVENETLTKTIFQESAELNRFIKGIIKYFRQ